METKGLPEVCEYVIATILGAAGVLLVNWFGRRYLDIDNREETHTHTHVYLGRGEPPLDEDEEEDL